jgi:hypothetical protein
MKKIVSMFIVFFMLVNVVPVHAMPVPVRIKSVVRVLDAIVVKGDLPCTKYKAVSAVYVVGNRVFISVVAAEPKWDKEHPRRACDGVRRPFTISFLPKVQAGVRYAVYVNGKIYLTYRR